jgi:hypothetical protein
MPLEDPRPDLVLPDKPAEALPPRSQTEDATGYYLETAARLLNAAAATLAAGVATDSTAEHYRAGFHNRVMFVAPVVSAAVLGTAISAAFRPEGGGRHRSTILANSVLTGLVGFVFHLTNTSKRAGGWTSTNVFYGAPIAAPLGLTIAGVLGLAASRVRVCRLAGDPSLRVRSTRHGVVVGYVAAVGLIGTSLEAGVLHFRGAFQNPFMYAPVIIPPVTAATLVVASLSQSSRSRVVAEALLRLTGWLGLVGTGFHAWGVHRRMGGWRNWRQNLLAGPPLPAPLAFTGLALAGLAATELLNREHRT